MKRRKWVVAIAIALLISGGIVFSRPAAPPASPAVPEPHQDPQDTTFTPPVMDLDQLLDRSKLVEFVCINESDAPCKLSVEGGFGDNRGSMSADLAAGPARSTMAVGGPPATSFTIEAVTVERAGVKQRREMKVSISVGERREIRVRSDGSVVVVTAKP